MADVFLSYDDVDRARVKPIAEALQKLGFSVWWDRYIPPGKTWARVIQEELDKAKCVIVIWSVTSVTSEWVEIEAARGKKRGILLPAMIDEVSSLIPIEFSRIQAVELIRWNEQVYDAEFQKLIAPVSQLIGEAHKGKLAERRFESQSLSSDRSNLSSRKKIKEWLLRMWLTRRRRLGLVLLALDFVLIGFVVTIFDLTRTEPSWEKVFAGFTLFIVPTASLILIFTSRHGVPK